MPSRGRQGPSRARKLPPSVRWSGGLEVVQQVVGTARDRHTRGWTRPKPTRDRRAQGMSAGRNGVRSESGPDIWLAGAGPDIWASRSQQVAADAGARAPAVLSMYSACMWRCVHILNGRIGVKAMLVGWLCIAGCKLPLAEPNEPEAGPAPDDGRGNCVVGDPTPLRPRLCFSASRRHSPPPPDTHSLWSSVSSVDLARIGAPRPESSRVERNQAREYFREAMQARNDQRYEDCVRLLNAAATVVVTIPHALNLAGCQEPLGELAAALTNYAAVMDSPDSRPEWVSHARERYQLLLPHVPTLTVHDRTHEAGLRIELSRIDPRSREAELPSTAWAIPVRIDPGTYAVGLRHEDFETPRPLALTVQRGEHWEVKIAPCEVNDVVGQILEDGVADGLAGALDDVEWFGHRRRVTQRRLVADGLLERPVHVRRWQPNRSLLLGASESSQLLRVSLLRP